MMHSSICSNLDVQHKDQEEKQQDAVHKDQLIRTFCLYAVFFALGLTSSISGPALVHVGYLYGTDVAGMSIVYICASVGYLTGSLLCAMVFDRFSHELQLLLCTLLMGLVCMVQPWLPHLYLFYFAAFVKDIGMGFLDSCGQSYIIKLWTGHRFKDPAMQGVHGIWSLGSFIGPFIVSPFLVELPTDMTNITESYNVTHNFTAGGYELTSPNVDLHEDIDGLEKIRYPYVIIGVVSCVCAAAYIPILCCVKSETKTKSTKITRGTNNEPKSGETLQFKLPMLAMLFIFYFFYAWYECIPGGYIAAFVIKGFHWPVHKGPLLASVFWGALGIGRVLGAPISIFFSSTKMIVFNIGLTTTGFVMMAFSSVTPEYVLWISVAAAGFGMSTTFASAILWTSQYITIIGSIGSLFLIGSSCGAMSGTALAGFLFQNKTHMWIVYLSLIAVLSHIVLFTVMFVFAKCHMAGIDNKNKRLQKTETEEELENMSPNLS